jgi:hypothetical protein
MDLGSGILGLLVFLFFLIYLFCRIGDCCTELGWGISGSLSVSHLTRFGIISLYW